MNMIKPLSIALAIAAAFPQLSYAEEELARVVVTGSNIRTSQKEGASAVQVLTAKELAATGKTTVADILRTISANSGNSYNEQYTGSFSAARPRPEEHPDPGERQARVFLRHRARPAGSLRRPELAADGGGAAH
jgi:hypothetical protein